MSRKHLRKVTARAAKSLGLSSQVRVTQEECGELIAAINRYARRRVKSAAVASEAADVYITLEYVRLLVGDEAVDAAIAKKLARLESRLEKAK